MSAAKSTATDLDAVVVGAGFAGIYALQNLRSKGFRTRVYEAANGVGGTWYWNRYPGARCDIPSLQYSYSFDESLQQEWRWKNKYSDQADILDYANHVVERFDCVKTRSSIPASSALLLMRATTSGPLPQMPASR
jgi:cyclohexanone monooxygenase